LKPILNVWSLLVECFFAKYVTKLESIPPERKHPTGLSETRCCLTDFSSFSSNSLFTSLKFFFDILFSLFSYIFTSLILFLPISSSNK